MSASGSTLSPLTASAAEVVRSHRKTEVLPELLEKKLGIERWQAVLVLKELADEGYGKYIVGRRGGETRLEKADQLPPNLAGNSEEFGLGAAANVFCQSYHLMRSPPFRVEVPADLTYKEAEKIANWLKAIAIDSGGD